MPGTDKNKSGGHSHAQKDNKNNNEQGDSRKSASPEDSGSDRKGERVKESFGKSGAKDSH